MRPGGPQTRTCSSVRPRAASIARERRVRAPEERSACLCAQLTALRGEAPERGAARRNARTHAARDRGAAAQLPSDLAAGPPIHRQQRPTTPPAHDSVDVGTTVGYSVREINLIQIFMNNS